METTTYADQWLTQSMSFFPLDAFAATNNNADIVLPNIVQHQQPQQQHPTKIGQTAQLLREFDSVYEVVELTHLTPPQSPPRSTVPKQTGSIFSSQHTNNNLNAIPIQQHPHQQQQLLQQQQQQQILQQQAAGNYFHYDASIAGSSPMQPVVHDIAHEMQVVEELVRARAEHLPDWQLLESAVPIRMADDYDDCDDERSSSSSLLAAMNHHSLLMPPSPSLSDRSVGEQRSASSSASSSCSSSASSSPTRSESSYDVDWTPAGSPAGKRRVVGGASAATPTTTAAASAKAARRPRPYGRSTEDKKSRKKEQNKNAATRYRQKKKAEIEVALDEERELLDVHAGLQATCADIEREIKYLKNLMRDLYRAKQSLAAE